MLKVIIGILKERLETKLGMETLSWELWRRIDEPCVSDSEEDCGSVRGDENAGHMITSARQGLNFMFNELFIREGFCIN